MPYLNLDLDCFSHPKVRRLVSLIGPTAPLYLIKLWCYAGKHFPMNGVLKGCSKHDLEKEVGWEGTAGEFIDACVEKKLIEVKNANYRIRNWKQHAGHLWAFKKRAKTAAKKRWTSYATSNAPSNAKGCAPNLPILTSSSSLHLQKDSEKEEAKTTGPPGGGPGAPNCWSIAEDVIGFLNEKTGKHFHARHPTGEPTKALTLVHSLLKKGYTLVNCRQVIANRCLKWRDDPKMEEFLRPETLFRPANFLSYLGELGKGMTHEPLS